MSDETPPPRASVRAFAAALWAMNPRRLMSSLALLLLSPVVEAAGVVALVPLLGAVGLPTPAGGAAKLGGITGQVLNAVGLRPTLAAALGVFVVVTAAQAVVQRAQIMAGYRIELDVSLHFRRRLYAAIAGARWLHFTRIRGSDLLQALTHECDRTGHAASYLLSVYTTALVSAAYFALALHVSTAASLVAAACGALLMVALRGYTRAVRRHGEGLSRAHKEMTAA
ncbi:MAG TPA: hypothetical protein VGB15_12805, partial [Longimicrobium sp.]